jgi:nucleotide-binding universal stress UspA family protein
MPVPSYTPEQMLAIQAQAFDAVVAPLRSIFERANETIEAIRLTGNDAGDEIAAYARRARLDVLVMGSHGRGAFKAAVLGSVATRVAARCRIPLLIVRRPQPASVM